MSHIFDQMTFYVNFNPNAPVKVNPQDCDESVLPYRRL